MNSFMFTSAVLFFYASYIGSNSFPSTRTVAFSRHGQLFLLSCVFLPSNTLLLTVLCSLARFPFRRTGSSCFPFTRTVVFLRHGQLFLHSYGCLFFQSYIGSDSSIFNHAVTFSIGSNSLVFTRAVVFLLPSTHWFEQFRIH